jgi:outer membrane biosynthesis protein TonB
MHRLGAVLVLGALASGCAAATRAQAPVERPALEVPPVPPRVIEQAPLPEVEQVEPVIELTPKPAAESKPKTRPRDTGLRETQKPEPKPEAPPAAEPATVPPIPAQNAPSTSVLRPQTNADAAAAADRRITDMINRARGVLNNVDYQKLSDQRKGAYKEAQSQIGGAEVALKESNFELAQEMAEKAEKLANALRGG